MTSFHKSPKKATGAVVALSLGMASFAVAPASAAETSEWVDLPTVTNEGSAWVAQNGDVDGSAFTTDTVNSGEASTTSEWVEFESDEDGSAWVNEDGTIDNGSAWANDNLTPAPAQPAVPADGSTWVEFESDEDGSAWVNEDGTIDNGSAWANENLNPVVVEPAVPADGSTWVDFESDEDGSAWVNEDGTIDNGSVWVNENLNPAPIEEAPLVTDKGPGVTHELPEGHIGINGPGTTHELPFLPVDGSTWVDFESNEDGSAWVNEDGTIDNGSVWVNENLNPAPIEEAPLVTDNGPGTTHELPFLPIDGSTWVDFESNEDGSAWVNEDGTIDNGSVWVNENLNPAPIEEAPLVTDKGPGVTHELPEGHIGINGPGTTAEPKPTIDPSTIVVDDKTPATDEPSAPAVEETPAAEETSAPAVEETSAPAADETSAPAVEETEAAAAPVASNGTTQAPAAQAPAAQAPAANNAQQQNLAQTGASNATLLALGGLAVLVLGAGAVVAARRFQA